MARDFALNMRLSGFVRPGRCLNTGFGSSNVVKTSCIDLFQMLSEVRVREGSQRVRYDSYAWSTLQSVCRFPFS
jgi:hypothetical protein